jgi:hypothetical protein
MRIEKKNLPRTKIGIQSKWVLCAGYFLFIFMISYLFASGGRQLDGTPYEEYVGDFYQMKPEPGELSPISWREDGSHVAPNGMIFITYVSCLCISNHQSTEAFVFEF